MATERVLQPLAPGSVDREIDHGIFAAPAAADRRRGVANPFVRASDLLHFERTIGNRATLVALGPATRVQAKLDVGAADDPLEREADAVAGAVVRDLRSQGDSRSADEADSRATRPGFAVRQVRRAAVQRKYADLDLVSAKAALPPRAFAMVQRYNDGPVLGDLEGEAQTVQRDKDLKALQFILTSIPDFFQEVIPDVVQEWIDILSSTLQNIQRGEMEAVQAALELPTVQGPLLLPTFKELVEPQVASSILPGVDYIEARVNEDDYHLYAGQDYLNYGYSYKLFAEAPSKGGDIDIYVDPKQASADFKSATVGDAHHRFIWSGHHHKALTANLIPRGFPLPSYSWQTLTYKHNPKHVFTFNVANPLLLKIFNAAVSLAPAFVGRFAHDPSAFISDMIKGLLDIPEVIFVGEDEQRLFLYVSDLVAKAAPARYEQKVDELEKAAKNREQATSIAHILRESFASGTAPTVALGPTASVGYYSPEYDVIVLDPVKNASADEMLDTLAFEIGNAQRRSAFLADKKGKAAIEFGTMEDYLKLLMEALHSGGLNDLVEQLGIPEKFLALADAGVVLKMPEPKLDMPFEAELPGQKLRTALAFWKMQDWTDGQRRTYFTASAHAEGMAATGAGYKSETPTDAPTVRLATEGHPLGCFKTILLALLKSYPRATQDHVDELSPRHFGEFLQTGTVEKWERETQQDKAPRQDIWAELHREFGRVYPNASAASYKTLTYTDLGDFLLSGTITSWESTTS